MKRFKKCALSLFLAVSMAVSSFTGIISVSAEAGDTLYSFDASAIETIGNDTAESYGLTVDTSGTIWSVTKQDSSVRDSVYYDAVRFSTRSNIGAKTLMSLDFTNDTVNNASGKTFANGYYDFETEFSSLYKDSGYMSMNLSGAAGDIAELRMLSSSGDYTYTSEAYLVDASGNKIGNSVKYKGGNEKATGVNANAFAANILYLKMKVNLIDKTYSAWLVQRGTDTDGYSMTEATEADLLVENQPFNSNLVTDIGQVSFSVSQSAATNGVWLHNIFIKEGEAPVDPDTQTALDRAKTYMENVYKVTDESYGNVTTDLNLIYSWNDAVSGDDVTITWNSSDTTLIDHDGTYKAPEVNPETKSVTMTATLSYGGKKEVVTYELTIRKYTSEKLIDSEDFSGKTVIDGKVEGWELYDNTTKVDTLSNVSLSISDNKLVMTKTGTADEADYSERYRAMYRFKDVLAKDTYSKTYRTNLRGEYKVVTSFRPGINSSSSQFQLANIATGAVDAVPARVFAMCIAKPNSSPGVYEYISSSDTPTIYQSSINKTNATATYYINTETGTMSVQINDGEEYTHSATAFSPLQGMMYIMKSKASAGDTLTVNSIDLYRISAYDDGTDALHEATKTFTVASITDTPDAITADLDALPAQIGGASVEWTSSDASVMDASGALVERPIGEDKKVTLTAKLTKDNAVIYKEFYLTVAQEDDMEKVLAKAAEKITYQTLTSENTENITEDLNTLPLSGLYGSSITWTSSDTTVMSNSGEVLRLGSNKKLPVTMTATFSKNGVTYTKKFDFKIGLDFAAGLVTLYETDFSGAEIADNISSANGAGTVVQENNQILLKRNSNGGTATSINVYPTFNGRKMTVYGEMIIEADVNLRAGCQKAEIILYDTNGSRITTFYTAGSGNGPTSYTYVYKDTESGSENHTKVSVAAGSGLPLKVKVHVNPDTKKMTIYTDHNGNGYQVRCQDKYIRENATNLSFIQINAVDDGSYKNTGVLEVNSVKVSVNEGTIPELITKNIDYFGDIVSRNGVVAGNVTLPTDKYEGTTVTWTSSDNDVLSNSGEYQSENFSEDKNVTISFKLSLNNKPEICYEKDFDLTVLYIDPSNIAVGKTAKADIISNTGHGPEKAIDGISTTSWETMRSDETPSLTVALGQKYVISQIKLSEAEILGQYPVTGFVVETSTDNKKWNVAYTGTTLGSSVQTISITPTIASYVRYRVTSKNTGNSGLNEFGIYAGTDDTSLANADLLLLIDKLGSLTGLTSSVTLPNTGEYGSVFTYESSIPQNFSNSGVVSRTKQTASGTLKIKATKGTETVEKSIKISVAALGGYSGGGGGGSSSSSSGRGGGGAVAALPPQTNPSTSGADTPVKAGFKDVTENFWGYSFIETLRKNGIVSGDIDGNFRPDDNISREEFVKMLIGALKLDVSTTAGVEFSDISDNDWCKPYVSKAVSMGIVKGTSDELFGKGTFITRQDMALMCIRALEAVGKETASGESADFSDASQISDYALESVKKMAEMNIINGYDDNSFRPRNNATRAEAAKIISQLI